MNDQTPYAVTMPPKHANFVKKSARTHVTVYYLSKTDPDGFGEKPRAGVKLHWLSHRVYIDAYEFCAGSEPLSVYEPEDETTVFGYSNNDGIYFLRDMAEENADVLTMCAIKENAVIRFVAPRSGTFEITAVLGRETEGSSVVNATKDGAVIQSFTVTENETEVKFRAVLDENESVALDLVCDGSGDKVRARSLSTAIKLLYTGKLDREYNNDGQTPMHSVGIMCDLHIDGKKPLSVFPPKQVIVNAVDYLRARGGVDVLLLGGDIISEAIYHINEIEKSAWNYDNIISTIDCLDGLLAKSTKTGKNIFYVSGNHDKQCGVIAEQKDPSVRIHSGNYRKWITARSGDFHSALYMADITGDPALCRYPDEVLCYRYNIGGMEYIGINQSYTGQEDARKEHRGASQQMYPQQVTWIRKQLEEIGKEKTVMLICHYSFSIDGENREFYTPKHLTHLGDSRDMLIALFEEYPNVIYNYGHLHWMTEEEGAWYNTSEQIWSFGNKSQNEDGSFTTDGYHYIHAASISNTATRVDPSVTPGESTNVSQIMTVDFYTDHITFEIVNVGAKENVEGVRKMTTYTIKRDMSQLGK